MAAVTSREELKQYALRALGAPVLQINVEDEQLEDRLTDAFEYYHDMHYDGIEWKYYPHEITQDDVDNGYFPVPDNLIHVTRVLDFGGGFGLTGAMNDPNHSYDVSIDRAFANQRADSNFYARTHNDHAGGAKYDNWMLSYVLTQQQLEDANFLLGGEVPMTFSRHANRIQLHTEWAKLTVGNYFMVEGWIELDPDTFTDVYNDRWLKRYVTALFKRQWGINLKLYSGIQMPGGVTFDGQAMYDEAKDEIDKLEEEMLSTYQEPVDFFVG